MAAKLGATFLFAAAAAAPLFAEEGLLKALIGLAKAQPQLLLLP